MSDTTMRDGTQTRTPKRIGSTTRRDKADRSASWQQARYTAISARCARRAGLAPRLKFLRANGRTILLSLAPIFDTSDSARNIQSSANQ